MARQPLESTALECGGRSIRLPYVIVPRPDEKRERERAAVDGVVRGLNPFCVSLYPMENGFQRRPPSVRHGARGLRPPRAP